MNIHLPQWNRRRFLRVLGQGALLAALPGELLAAEDAVTISILHTTDLHGHILPTYDYHGTPNLGGLARCASQIRQWRAANPNSFYLDIGDVYQGTEVSLHSRGALMIRCLNTLQCEAWVVGNHEFDWGMGPLTESLQLSAMPVLSGNALVEGHPVGAHPEATSPSPLTRLRAWRMKEVAGFRIAIVGLTTPALTSWLPPENLRGYEALDPVEALRALLPEVAAAKPDAIILAGHMGLTPRDNNANRIGALTREFPQLTCCLGGHTHQNHGSELVNGVLYTQADHFGIYAGKVDLTFDRASRRLLHRQAITVPMDASVPFDPAILSLAHADLDLSHQALAQPMGELMETFTLEGKPGHPGDVERLIASSIAVALQKRQVPVDAVVHGLFDEHRPLLPGMKTIADAWRILPYENEIVTVELNREDLIAFLGDFLRGKDYRNVMGLRPVLSGEGNSLAVTDLQSASGGPLPPRPFYRIALNSFDSQSAGQRFLTAAALVARPSSHRVLHPVRTREALIDFFVTRKQVGRSSLLV